MRHGAPRAPRGGAHAPPSTSQATEEDELLLVSDDLAAEERRLHEEREREAAASQVRATPRRRLQPRAAGCRQPPAGAGDTREQPRDTRPARVFAVETLHRSRAAAAALAASAA